MKEEMINVGLTFYICSFVGFVYELILSYARGYGYHHGILYGPWLPIYGTGAVLITLLLNKYRTHPFIVFIASFFLTGTLELIIGFILHKFFSKRLWDYTGWFLNINGYVCLLSAFCFGVGGLIIIYLLKPLVDRLTKKVSPSIFKVILNIVNILFLSDVIATIIK